jgi:hypothetical protein
VPAAFTSPAVQSAIATELNLFGPASDPEYLLDVIRGHQQDICKRELATTFPGSHVTPRLPIDTKGDGKNERGVVRGS